MEKLNNQNKVIWKNQIKQNKKLDEISKDVKKMHHKDSLSLTFIQVKINIL